MSHIVSGHGSQVRDLDGDEVDGYDEGRTEASRNTLIDMHKVILPVDYVESGVIVDDVSSMSSLTEE